MASEDKRATTATISDEVASMWKSLDPAIRAALIASESNQGDIQQSSNIDTEINTSCLPTNNNDIDESIHDSKYSEVTLAEAERIITFSDAVVAIAMTLLILPLMESSAEFDFESMEKFWAEHWMNFVALFVSFWAIWKLWLTHEFLFMRVSHFNTGLHKLNFLWLLGIVMVPVFANFLMSGSVPLYLADFLFIRTITFFMGREIRYDKRVWKGSPPSSGLEMAFFVSVFVDMVLMLIGLILTIYVNMYCWAVIFLGHPIVMFCEWKWPQLGSHKQPFKTETMSSQCWNLLWEIFKIPYRVFRFMKGSK